MFSISSYRQAIIWSVRKELVMKNKTKLLLTILISLSLSACTTENNDELDETITATQNLIVLSDKTATIDGKKIDEYDYSWNISPAKKEAWY